MSASFASNPDVDVIRLLIDAGADVNAVVDNCGSTLLISASCKSNPDVVRLLIDAGANVNLKDRDGKNALYYCKNNKVLMGTEAFEILKQKTQTAFLNWLGKIFSI
jgi:ankyrin repeat protein